ncbi:cadherin-like domain-containing protein [uncultured Hydrogenophaga sp.]|uniref:cadherin-like domain-containing protein n=1 Tax=uncultured Hydrogenophaga sp. TaxID=199683 RepID=UPI00265FCA32|nr:cadherin-like domain-containing protein [uncultured Hydrogenophaga sp.]
MENVSNNLQALGYLGATGNTPYKGSSQDQLVALQAAYSGGLNVGALQSTSAQAVHLNVLLDGTQNNREFVAPGESPTNVGTLADLIERAGQGRNTIYVPGIGAQLTPDGAPSNWQSTPGNAGVNGQQIIERTYQNIAERIAEIRATDPNAIIEINIAGFSRGGAEAVALANLINERGLPGAVLTGEVQINSLTLFDPVNQTDGQLDVRWPTNLKNPALVFVATAENRLWFPAMAVGGDAIVIPIEGAHSNVGGTFNPDGIAAVTLKLASDYRAAVGAPVGPIPPELQPNWDRMYIHNSAIDNHGHKMFDTTGDPLQNIGSPRWVEGMGVGSPSVQQMLAQGVAFTPFYEQVNDRFVLRGFMGGSQSTATDPLTGHVTTHGDTLVYAPNGQTLVGHTTVTTVHTAAGQAIRTTAIDYEADWRTVKAIRTTDGLDTLIQTTTLRNAQGGILAKSQVQRFDDSSQIQTEQWPDGTTNVTGLDAAGKVVNITHIKAQPDGSRIETVTAADGRITRLTYDADGALLQQEAVSTAGQTLQNFLVNNGAALTDALSLLKAIQTGQPLPIVASGLRLANELSDLNGAHSAGLNAAANVASGVLSLYALDRALQQGDGMAALSAAAQTVHFAASAYAGYLGYTGNASATALQQAVAQGEFAAATNAVGTVSQALPYVNLVNALVHGDAVGTASAALMLNPATAPIGMAIAVAQLVFGLFDDVPDPWGAGQFTDNGSGISFQAHGETGGAEAVSSVMASSLAVLNSLIERQRQYNPGSTLGLIAQRMPTVGYDTSGFRYADIDPLTGAERHPALRFDTTGRPYNAEPGSPQSFQSLVEGVVRSALSRGALAPLWEVRTAQMQTAAGDPRAGLTEEERAARDGLLAAPLTGADQTFRPIALDLDGDGIEVTDRAHGQAFDVDGSGYLKQTAWLKADDAFLVLDRNYNGQFDNGSELFSNAAVALQRRGLAGLKWVDANGDGRITPLDPVWSELKVWRDANQNARQDAGEVQGLDTLGISALNPGMATYTRAGVQRQLGSPDLQADRQGSRATVVPEGILVQTSEAGELSLVVTRIDDLTPVQANRDGVTGYEDVELIISTADLLANDTLGGITGRDLTVTGLGAMRHGTGFIDANGFVHFLPEANYAGNGAGFDYVVRASNGQTTTASVDVSLNPVNDAPTLGQVTHGQRAIYGYTPIYQSDSETASTWVAALLPVYQPYMVVHDPETGQQIVRMDVQPGRWDATYHLTPVAYEDSGAGRVIGADVDHPAATLKYELVNGPQYGSVSINADGTFQYTSWKSSGVPSDRVLVDGTYGAYEGGSLFSGSYVNPPFVVQPTTDVFQVRITDPQGASSIQSISVPHFGPYMPPMPPGGGGKKPIAIDLDGDGFEFVGVDDSQVFFDVDGTGWKRRMAWVGRDDGLLAFDANGDGRIDQGNEIGFAGYLAGAQTDLQGLAAFDSNGDGHLSPQDERWARLGFWQDADQDGVTDTGEFRSLSAMGVASVDLSSDGQFQVIQGQTVHGVGRLWRTDGSSLALADVTLEVRDPMPRSGGVTAPVVGTAGADLIIGQAGDDALTGGDGDDVILDDAGNDSIDPGDGNDQIFSGADTDLVLAGAGNDTVHAGLGDDRVFGGDGNDAVLADGGNDVVFGGAGDDLLSGGWGNDVLSGDEGDDQLFGEAGADALIGGAGHDLLMGMEGDDALYGGAGDDGLDGGTGADDLQGGAGDDTYTVDQSGDRITERPGEGIDTVRTTLDHWQLASDLENLVLLGAADLGGIGNGADNRLQGNGGRNRLEGGAGQDHIDGGWGADLMVGGTGDDTYVVDDAGDRVDEKPGEGTDTVLSHISYLLPDQVEHLQLLGSAAIDATGNALDNTLTGNAGHNRLDGGAGADTLVGGAGDDTYVVDQANDRIVELAGQGDDTVISSVDWALGTHLENGRLSGTAHLSLTGNALANTLTGNTGDNRLDGGVGADTLIGGAGDDTYVIDNAGDRVVELSGGGTDTVLSDISYVLPEQVEHLQLLGSAAIHATGNALDNTLTGNAGSNRLDGGAGVDTLIGGAGDDTYVVDNGGDRVVELLGGDTDAVFSRISYVLPEHVEHLQLLGTVAIDATGNALDNILTGNAGNNLLLGGVGNDRLLGLAGDDVYVYRRGDGLDRIEEISGTDTLRLGAGLTANQIALRVAGTGAVRTASLRLLDADGQELPDQGVDFAVAVDAQGRITSSIERFELTDGSVLGFDALRTRSVHTDIGRSSSSLVTGRHDDWVHGDCRAQTLRTGSGHDIVLGFGGADTLWGEGGNDALFGGAHNDRLEGGVGNDFLAGGQHDDLIQAGAGSNVIGFNRGDGKDTLHSLAGASNTLSLGGGLDLDDLALRRSGGDLIVQAGERDQITLQGWYAGSTQQTVQRLQIIESTGQDHCHAPAGTGWRIDTYDFSAVVRAFDAAPVKTTRQGQVSPWRMTDAGLQAHLSSSTTAALGGELATWYASEGRGPVTVASAQQTLLDSRFGVQSQSVGRRFDSTVSGVQLG